MIEPKISYRTSEGRPIYECCRCGQTYSARGAWIKSPECAAMCQSCEDAVSAAAALLGLIGMAQAVIKCNSIIPCAKCKGRGWIENYVSGSRSNLVRCDDPCDQCKQLGTIW